MFSARLLKRQMRVFCLIPVDRDVCQRAAGAGGICHAPEGETGEKKLWKGEFNLPVMWREVLAEPPTRRTPRCICAGLGPRGAGGGTDRWTEGAAVGCDIPVVYQQY